MSLQAPLQMKITTEMLLAKEACANQVALFRKTFGESADITLGNCLKASSVGLSIGWAAENLLSPPAREAYEEAAAAAWEAYRRDISAAQKAAAREAAAAAQKAFERDISAQKAAAREARQDIFAAREAYERDIAYARGAYRRATAVAFFAVAGEHAGLGEK